jgi:hypothetical protein
MTGRRNTRPYAVVERELADAQRRLEATRHGDWLMRAVRAERVADLTHELNNTPLVPINRSDIEASTHVRLHDGWTEVVRVNRETVSVAVGENRVETIRFDRVLECRAVS